MDDSRDDEQSEVMNEDQEQMEIWKRNIPLFYKSFVGHILEWGSLTCQFLPEIKTTNDYVRQKIILGTSTNNKEQNYLYVAKVTVPNSESQNFNKSTYKISDQQGSFLKPGINCIEFEAKINHPTDVYKARASYNSYNLIATKGSAGDVLIFDYTKHPLEPSDNQIHAQMCLTGHDSDGWGLDWTYKGHYVISSDDQGRVCLWDLEKSPISEKSQNHNPKQTITLNPLLIEDYEEQKAINDIKFHKFYQSSFGFVQDCNFQFVDVRMGTKNSTLQWSTGDSEAFCLDFSPDHEFLVLTGDNDGQVALWDFRKQTETIHQFRCTGSQIDKVEWNQRKCGVFCAGTKGNQLRFYDCSKMDVNDGLFFIHPGCEGGVCDLNWNPHIDFGMVSVNDANQIQVFELDPKFYYCSNQLYQ